jgi:hypothetical protein
VCGSLGSVSLVHGNKVIAGSDCSEAKQLTVYHSIKGIDNSIRIYSLPDRGGRVAGQRKVILVLSSTHYKD